MRKPRAVIIGGKKFNISKQVYEHFDIVRHFEQGELGRIVWIRGVDLVLVVRDFVGHKNLNKLMKLFEGTPIVAARSGWSHLYTELVRRGLLAT